MIVIFALYNFVNVHIFFTWIWNCKISYTIYTTTRRRSDDFRCPVLRRKHTPFSIFYLSVCYRL